MTVAVFFTNTLFSHRYTGVLHPYQFAFDDVNAAKIMEVYDYEWTDEEI
ncbi:MAG: hypothetical protein ACI4WM_04630 [Erysipelotrichaceae bacterium]